MCGAERLGTVLVLNQDSNFFEMDLDKRRLSLLERKLNRKLIWTLYLLYNHSTD